MTPASTGVTTQVRHLGITDAEAQQVVAEALARNGVIGDGSIVTDQVIGIVNTKTGASNEAALHADPA
jgi:hypothetical protein